MVSSVGEKPGEGLAIKKENPSPGSNVASLILATLSHKGRGEEKAEAIASIRRQRNAIVDELIQRRLDVDLGVDHARLL